MTPRFTVLSPTHDHGELLRFAIESVLHQTVDDLEVLIVGDGATEVTRDVALALEKQDERVRFFDNPKGPNRGEVHRGTALENARGDIVCYLCDDDLWLPDHLAEMDHLLTGKDFAHTLPFHIQVDGSVHLYPGDLSREHYRRAILEGHNFIPFSCGAHTLELYRASEGWQTSPPEAFTDLTMWQRLLRAPGCRAISGTLPTLIHFPSSDRTHWSLEQRIDEMQRWERDMRAPGFRERLLERLLSAEVRNRSEVQERMEVEREGAEYRFQERERQLTHDLESVRGTRTWQWRERLLRAPGIGRLARAAGRARARRSDR